jgi:8-oxo-dGTP diphosphatase
LPELTYVVVGARENGKWIFVRHRDRNTWELPAGHIDKNESADEAACRELYEETGTVKADMSVLKDYSVTIKGETKFGRIYLAYVRERGPKPDSEITEIKISKDTPLPATYPTAHKRFLELLEASLV